VYLYRTFQTLWQFKVLYITQSITKWKQAKLKQLFKMLYIERHFKQSVLHRNKHKIKARGIKTVIC